MCVISMIGDEFSKTIPRDHPWTNPFKDSTGTVTLITGPTQEEFDKLKKEVESIKKLLQAAKIYDEETGQPDCETDEKMAFLRKLAEFLGVELGI